MLLSPTVLVTADPSARGPLVRALRRFGVGVRCVPTVTLLPVRPGTPEGEALDAALRLAPRAARLVVTSPRGARIVLGRLAALGVDPRRLRWAAVGRSTARSLRDAGAVDVLVPATADGASLAEAIAAADVLPGATVVLARASAAAGDLPARLAAAGARVVEAVAYRTVEGPNRSRATLGRALADPGLSAVVFASGSAVRGLRSLATSADLARARHLPAIVIGPRTAAVARAEGFARIVVAAEPSPTALARAVVAVVGEPSSTDGEPAAEAPVLPEPLLEPHWRPIAR
ncbi:MAG TPA: uroporphyrinogen-III synthase [Candidatus Binatia bacterium]|nr:uroporphyrinogen-III synthase [Candidatus Binatia bacterium]